MNDEGNAVQGIVWAFILSLPIWALIVLIIWAVKS